MLACRLEGVDLHILITGGAGFVGRHLTRRLISDGHHVRILDILSKQVHDPTGRVPPGLQGIEFLHGDVRDPTLLARALEGVDAVAHLAAETGVGQSMYEVNRYVDLNDRGTACLLQALIDCQRPVHVVLGSSRAVYGEGLYHCERCGEVSPTARDPAALSQAVWDPVCPSCGSAIAPVATHEEAPRRPGSVYAVTKITQEHLCQVIGSAYGLSTVILRYFNVYGPGQSLLNPYTGILSTFYVRAKSGKEIEVFEDGKESRDFVYIDDVVEATRRALLYLSGGRYSGVLNIGSGVSVSVYDLARMMIQVGGWDVPIRVTGAFRVGDVRHAFADTSRASRVLGFNTTISLEEGLRKWLQWAERSDYRDSTDSAAAQLTERGLYRNAGGMTNA